MNRGKGKNRIRMGIWMVLFFIYMGSLYPSKALDFSNMSVPQKEKILKEKVQEMRQQKNSPLVLTSAGKLKNEHMQNTIIVSGQVQGDVHIENCIFEGDIILTSSSIENIYMIGTQVKGDIYIVTSMPKSKITIENTTVNTVWMNAPMEIIESGRKARIQKIITSKDMPKESVLKIRANIDTFVNYADKSKVYFYGNINKLVVNKKFSLGGEYSYKKKVSHDTRYPDTILYDLNDFSTKKGYESINDHTAYEDLYNLLEKEQYNYKDRVSVIVKNPSVKGTENLNRVVLDQFSKYLPNQASASFITNFTDLSSQYGLYNIHFIYDTDVAKIKKANAVINSMYKEIKHLDGVEYIKQVNRMLARKIIYDESLKRHSMYDAVVNGDVVCEGYAKAGYELLRRKFGKKNTILIANKEHIWNMVKLNGKWYHIDFTHNDPPTKPFVADYYTERFLLVSDTQLKERAENGRTWEYRIYPSAKQGFNL